MGGCGKKWGRMRSDYTTAKEERGEENEGGNHGKPYKKLDFHSAMGVSRE